MRSIDVGHEVQPRSLARIGRQRFGHHRRSEIRAANPDIDDVGDPGAGVSGPFAAADAIAEAAHVLERGEDVGHDVAAVNSHGPAREIPQRDMEDGAILGHVDFFAGKHPVAQRFDLPLAGELVEEVERFLGDEMLRVVDEQVAESAGKPSGPLGVAGEPVTQMFAPDVVTMRLQTAPDGELAKGWHGGSVT
jgi:hypothetical protein